VYRNKDGKTLFVRRKRLILEQLEYGEKLSSASGQAELFLKKNFFKHWTTTYADLGGGSTVPVVKV
jgi:hypothetical protein